MKNLPLSESNIDLYSLHLLRTVAEFRGFTAASKACGLSQSALTRQVQSIESRLGIKVFDRTTRVVKITEPGAVLLRETEAIPGILGAAMRRIREGYLGTRREIRIGISNDLALAHIAGIFHAQRKHQPDVRIVVSQMEGSALMRRVGNSGLDLGVLTAPAALPENVTVTHQMADQFSIVVPNAMEAEGFSGSIARFRKWADSQSWLLPPDKARTRQLIDVWARENRMELQPIMELENFDLMVQFVSMGMGAALIPRRSFGTFRRKALVRVIAPPVELSRRLIVISPQHGKCPEHVSRFVAGILFS
jgi:DNA-binding transcriptional LysR family regulator